MAHDYKRDGATTLFAALYVSTGVLLFQVHAPSPERRALDRVRLIGRSIGKTKNVHLIFNSNYGTHKHPSVRAWLATHPRFELCTSSGRAPRGWTSSSRRPVSVPTRGSGEVASRAWSP